MSIKTLLAGASIALVALGTSACTSGLSTNRSLESVHQPVIQKSNYTLDLTNGYDGLPVSEQQRLAAWLDTIDVRFSDTVMLDDPTGNRATRAAVAAAVGKHSLLLADGAPTTPGAVPPGAVRVIVSRAVATVEGCPDWHVRTDFNPNNATSPGYGCAVNGNFAAMVANPDDLLRGQRGTGQTTVMTSDKAVESYRERKPTGQGKN